MTKKRIGIWGQFGSNQTIADGQAIRTTIITQEIINRYGLSDVNILNTNNWTLHPIRFLFKSVFLIAKSQNVIILPANNGLRIFVPILLFVNYFFHRNIYYIVIGGFLPQFIKDRPGFVKKLNTFDGLFVQTDKLRSDLVSLGIKRVYILSNLKPLQRIDISQLKINDNECVSVCTLSRVTVEKGIVDAIDAVRLANNKLGGLYIRLDIYGTIDSNFKDEFELLLKTNADFVKYKGVIEYLETVNVLKNYFALLFPTYYSGEGFPGNLIDSFYSGLPIIASDWMYNKDIIINKKNGILTQVKNPNDLSEALLTLYNNRSLTHDIAVNNVIESFKYEPELVMRDFFSILDEN